MKIKEKQLYKILIMLIVLIGLVSVSGFLVSADDSYEEDPDYIIMVAGIELNESNNIINQEDCEYITGSVRYISRFEIILDNFRYNFEAAKNDGAELPKIFIYTTYGINIYIKGDVSFDFQSVDKNTPSQGIISTNGHIATYNYSQYSENGWYKEPEPEVEASLNIGVNGIIFGARHEISIRGVQTATLVNSKWNHIGIIAGADLYYDEVTKDIKDNYGEYGFDTTKFASNLGEIYINIPTLKAKTGDPFIAGSQFIIIKDTVIEGVEYENILGEKTIPLMNGIVTPGTLTIDNSKFSVRSGSNGLNGEFQEVSMTAKNIVIKNGSEIKVESVMEGIWALETVSVCDSTIYLGSENDYPVLGIYGNDIIIKKSNIYSKCYSQGISSENDVIIEDSYVDSYINYGGWYKDTVAILGQNVTIKNSDVKAVVDPHSSTYYNFYCIKTENLNITNSDVTANTELQVPTYGNGDNDTCAIYVSGKMIAGFSNINASVGKYSGDEEYVDPEGNTLGNANAIKAQDLVVKNDSNINAYSYAQTAVSVENELDVSNSKLSAISDKAQAIDSAIIEGLHGTASGSDVDDMKIGLDLSAKVVELTPTYSISATPSEFGNLVITPNIIRPNGVIVGGDEITLLITPINGYVLDEVKVYKSDDKNVLFNVVNSKFVMPNYDVIIEVIYKKLPEIILNYGDNSDKTLVDSLIVPSPEVVPGKIFMGWFDDEEYTIPHDFTKPFENGDMLYAKYVDYIDYTKEIDKLSQNIEEALENLENLINKKADKTSVNSAFAKIQAAIEELENAKCEYENADEELKKVLEAVIDAAKKDAIEASKNYIPYIGSNGNWWIGDTDTGVNVTGKDGLAGKDGIGVLNIKLTSTKGLEDTYTVTLTNGDTYTFTVTNGINGVNGTNGVDGNNYIIPIIISICALLSNVLMFLWMTKQNKKKQKSE